MIARLGITTILAAAAVSGVACSSSDGSDGGAMFELPQIVPDNNPVCLSRRHVAVGETLNQPILLRNDGRQPLMISGAMIDGDTRGHFSIQGPDVMKLESFELATILLRYAPTTEGWDAVRVQVMSNAQNYATLNVFVLARAEPPGLDGGTYDAGDKPAEAMMACETTD